MELLHALRPIDLARSAGMSVQQVRNYESLGLAIPLALDFSSFPRYLYQG